METGHIILVFIGVAALMVLSKHLFKSEPTTPKIPPALELELQQAGKRMGTAAKPALLFAEASMLLPREAGNISSRARLGAAFYLAGATDYVAQAHELNDIEFASVLSTILSSIGLMSEAKAETFVEYLSKTEITPFGHDAMMKGGNAMSEWMSGKDKYAPARLMQYMSEWSEENTGT